MQFPTLIFALFFVATLTVSWLLHRHRTPQKFFLLLASYWFYAGWNWLLLSILLGSSLLNYTAGEMIARAPSRDTGRAWMWAGIIANLLVLGFFKYYNFFTEALSSLLGAFGLTPHLPLLEILLPVGISFYTFQAISYVVDVQRKPELRAGSLLDFLLFMAFFPKLLSGPITRAKELLPQLAAPAPTGVAHLSRAAALILSGLLKKVVLATLIDTHLVMAAFDTPENYTAPALWLGMLGYALLLYWDFSGYTDMALGLALLLGFRLPENFNHPYIAADISDFWRRWHITLSNWLRDYLFVPLGGLTLRGRWSAVVLTMVLAGLWHGAGWTFVLWGTYHGLLLFIHHGLKTGLKIRWKGGWLGRAGTFLLVCFGWVLFKSADLPTAWLYLSRMFSFRAEGTGFEALVLLLIVLGLVLQVIGPRLRESFIGFSERLPFALRPVLWFALGLAIAILKPHGIAPYIYFGF